MYFLTTSNNHSYRLWLPVVIVISILYLGADIASPFNMYDEGIAVVGAERVLLGEAPHLDFWTVYPFGNYLVLAGAFSVFGKTLMVERILTLVWLLLLVVSLYLLLRTFYKPIPTLIGTFAAIIIVGGQDYWGRSLIPSLFFSTMALLFLIHYSKKQHGKLLALCALFIILSSCFRLDIGLYALCACTLGFTIHKHFLETPQLGLFRLLGKSLVMLCIGILTLLLIFLFLQIILYGFGSLKPALSQLLVFPLTAFPSERGLPLPFFIRRWSNGEGIKEIIFTSTLFYFVITVLVLASKNIISCLSNNIHSLRYNQIIPVLLFGLLLFNQARVRSDAEHIVPSLLLTIPLFIWVFAHIHSKYLQTFALLAVSFILALPIQSKVHDVLFVYKADTTQLFRISTLRGIVSSEVSMREQLVQYINNHTLPNQPIFICNNANDRFVVNDVINYFLTQHPPATRYHELHSGVANTSDVQQEIIASLYNAKPSLILRMECEPGPEPNGTGKHTGVLLLDNYILQYYYPAKQFDYYTVWLRKESINE